MIKHAGPEAHVTVTLERHGSDIQFAFVDDGAGFTHASGKAVSA